MLLVHAKIQNLNSEIVEFRTKKLVLRHCPQGCKPTVGHCGAKAEKHALRH